MLHENDDLERMALERHRLTELLAPQVSQVDVELLALSPPFAQQLPQAHIPSSDINGSPDSSAYRPRYHVITTEAHGAVCAWQDDYDSLPAEATPSCSGCKDNGAVGE